MCDIASIPELIRETEARVRAHQRLILELEPLREMSAGVSLAVLGGALLGELEGGAKLAAAMALVTGTYFLSKALISRWVRRSSDRVQHERAVRGWERIARCAAYMEDDDDASSCSTDCSSGDCGFRALLFEADALLKSSPPTT